jgi:hypothetical protein
MEISPVVVEEGAKEEPMPVRAALLHCCKRTTAGMAWWGMTGGPEEIGVLRDRDNETRLVRLLGQGLLG